MVAADGSVISDATLWTAYDAGSGSIYLAAENGMFVSVDNSDGAVLLASNASAAQILQFSSLPANVSTSVIATCSRSTPSQEEMFYTVGGLSPYLLFPLSGHSPPAGVLTSLKVSLITPALSAIQSSLNAVSYDLRAVDLTGANLAGVNCTGAQFQGATLQNTNFAGANLASAHFAATDIRGVIWGDNIQAAGADFTGSIGCGMVVISTGTPPGGPQATFDNAIFTNADFDADFNGAHLEGVAFAGAQMYYVAQGNLNNAFLIETDLSGADLTGTPFNKSIVQGANFDEAILIGCIVTSVNFVPSSEGEPVSMVGAHLEGTSSWAPRALRVSA
ncbi:MAG TPA: pentapeptide repeat-containing protein [Bryobacteraceae bacterium]|nr:pentapeptide repeat-containing protein [Bryobacteraceae bacterium]